MALIKNANASILARDAIVLDLGDLRQQADEIIRQAGVQAARITSEARAERERILVGATREGHEKGFAAGREEGRARGHEEAMAGALAEHSAQLKQVDTGWLACLGEFARRREDLVQDATRDVVRLATVIAERVVKRAVRLDAELVVDQVAAALAVVVRPTQVVLHVHPEDRAIVARALPGLMAAMPSVKHAEMVDDASVERGGCVLRTRADAEGGEEGAWGGGRVDARLSVQIDRIVEALLPGDADAPTGEPGAGGLRA
ncbi:MAG TPA: FliH/SctL family protein [Phycisphaerales bacterium]|nr:FliH/SctL family protein [Phycisphaerales bacterium]